MSSQSKSSPQLTAITDTPTITFRVTGMTCAGCAAGLQKHLAADPQVENASVSIISGLARVRTRLSAQDLIDRIRQRGFEATQEVNSSPASAIEQQQQSAERLWKRRAVAGLSLWVPLELLHWSATALHWHPQPHAVIREWARVLRTDGLLMFCCFGPDSLRELREAFAVAGDVDAGHVLPFVDLHDYGDMLVAAGFATPVMDMEKLTITYSTTDKLLADVRALGGNPLLNRGKGLYGRGVWQRMIDALMITRGLDGKLPLTIEVIYGHAFKPQARRTAAGESIIRFDMKRS